MNILVLGDSLCENLLVWKLSQSTEEPTIYQWPKCQESDALSLEVEDDSSPSEIAKAISKAQISFAVNLSQDSKLGSIANILQILRIPFFGCNGLSHINTSPARKAAEFIESVNNSQVSLDSLGLSPQIEDFDYSILVSNNKVLHLGATITESFSDLQNLSYECTRQLPIVFPENFTEDFENNFIRPAIHDLNGQVGYEYSGWMQIEMNLSGNKLTIKSFKTVAESSVLQTFVACDDRDWLVLIAQLLGYETSTYACRYMSPKNAAGTLGVLVSGTNSSNSILNNSVSGLQEKLHIEDQGSSYTCFVGEIGSSVIDEMRKLVKAA